MKMRITYDTVAQKGTYTSDGVVYDCLLLDMNHQLDFQRMFEIESCTQKYIPRDRTIGFTLNIFEREDDGLNCQSAYQDNTDCDE